MRLPALGSVLATSALLVGCSTRPVVLDGTLAPGKIAMRIGTPGLVVAAPHARAEPGTADMAAEIAERTGFGIVVAAGADDGAGDEAYERRVRDASQGQLRFYVELHGHGRGETAGRIDIATVGVDAEEAVKLRTLLELVRDAHLRGRPPGLRLDVRVEPAPTRAGILRLPQRALSIELPPSARQNGRSLYAVILADFLREAVALPLPVRR